MNGFTVQASHQVSSKSSPDSMLRAPFHAPFHDGAIKRTQVVMGGGGGGAANSLEVKRPQRPDRASSKINCLGL
jgi:hypothetical protein